MSSGIEKSKRDIFSEVTAISEMYRAIREASHIQQITIECVLGFFQSARNCWRQWRNIWEGVKMVEIGVSSVHI